MICIQLKIKCKTILLKTLENGLNKSYFMTYQPSFMLLERICFFVYEHFKILVDCSLSCFENHGRLSYNMNSMSMGYITPVFHAGNYVYIN